PASDPPADPAPPAAPAVPWTSEPPRTWSPPPQAPDASWRSDAPRRTLAAQRALESEDVWTAIGPLVAVLSAAVVVGVLAALLAVG
ncbi:MAG: hypothetical protein AVDCRST_MAG88-1031, partial [uncultured Thermomicrobiales bacterium]